MNEGAEGGARVVRRSPLAAKEKLCPRCLKPLSRGNQLGGWLISQDYYCRDCGYYGTVFLESARDAKGDPSEKA